MIQRQAADMERCHTYVGRQCSVLACRLHLTEILTVLFSDHRTHTR